MWRKPGAVRLPTCPWISWSSHRESGGPMGAISTWASSYWTFPAPPSVGHHPAWVIPCRLYPLGPRAGNPAAHGVASATAPAGEGARGCPLGGAAPALQGLGWRSTSSPSCRCCGREGARACLPLVACPAAWAPARRALQGLLWQGLHRTRVSQESEEPLVAGTRPRLESPGSAALPATPPRACSTAGTRSPRAAQPAGSRRPRT